MSHHSVDGKIVGDVPVQEKSTPENLVHHHSMQPSNIVPYGGAIPRGFSHLNMEPFNSQFPGATPQMSYTAVSLSADTSSSTDNPVPRMIFLPSCPPSEVWNNIVAATKTGFSVSGTAARGNVGPVVGLVDIGESADSYMFRVSLPGVKRNEKDFSCEVESVGKVIIKGTTTAGETTVYRYSQAFKMQSQNLCPSGYFSLSFHLPGPVDPCRFSGTFGTDGILEGVVMKVQKI